MATRIPAPSPVFASQPQAPRWVLKGGVGREAFGFKTEGVDGFISHSDEHFEGVLDARASGALAEFSHESHAAGILVVLRIE